MLKKKVLNSQTAFLTSFIFLLPVIALAQATATETLANNHQIIEMLGLVTPLSINPYLTLFMSCIVSILGIGGGFLESNPALDNNIMLWLSLALFLLTFIPNLTKTSKSIGLVVAYLEEYSVMVIYAILFLVPIFTTQVENNMTDHIDQLSFLNLDVTEIIFICISIPILTVMITVRLFLDFLIFVSPIPLLDSIFEFLKSGFTFVFFLIYLLFPGLAIVLCILFFFIAFIFYRRAKALLNYFRYLAIHAVLKKLWGGRPELIDGKIPENIRKQFDHIQMALPGITFGPANSIKPKTRIWLIYSNQKLYLCHEGWYFKSKIYEMSGQTSISRDFYVINLSDQNQVKVQLNAFYIPLYKQIAVVTKSEDKGLSGIAGKTNPLFNKLIQKLKKISVFSNTQEA